VLIAQRPSLTEEVINPQRSRFTFTPLEPGFGYTLGNSLRRTLLSSIPGAAVTSVRISGALHEFTTLPGVKEDVTEILLNIKGIVLTSEYDEPVAIYLHKSGEGEVTAGDITEVAGVVVANPDLHIATLAEDGELEIEFTVERGRGYVPAQMNKQDNDEIGRIPVDSIYSPVLKVSYKVEATRVDQRTDFDKLILDVETKQAISPRDAIASAGSTLVELFGLARELNVEAEGIEVGAAPVVAQAAKDIGALTVAVVTMPFMFEGKKRRKLADCGLEELRKESDSIVVIPNDKLLTLIDKNAGIKESFEMVDEVLARAVNGMSTIVLDSGKSDINLDFADVRTIMSHRGLALMGVGEANGEDAAQEAIKNAIQSPLLDNMTINGAFGILVHFRISPSCPLTDIYNAMSIIHEAADEDAEIIFGTTTDDKIEDNKVEVTIIATGFQGSQQEVEKNEDVQVSNTNDIIKKERILRLKKVSGGFDEDYMAQLDVPSFMRHQMD